jgi:hypothetical protein
MTGSFLLSSAAEDEALSASHLYTAMLCMPAARASVSLLPLPYPSSSARSCSPRALLSYSDTRTVIVIDLKALWSLGSVAFR